jgi:hypothetical protein
MPDAISRAGSSVDLLHSFCEGRRMYAGGFHTDFLATWARARSALVACLAMTLLIVGAAARPVPPGTQPAPQGTTVDKSSVTEPGIRPSQASLRLVSDTRPSRPVIGGDSPTALISSTPLAGWAPQSPINAKRAYAAPARDFAHPAHRPRGPPDQTGGIGHAAHRAGVVLLVSWNRGSVFQQGLHRA